jgi:phosphatidate cytidylyltransferase
MIFNRLSNFQQRLTISAFAIALLLIGIIFSFHPYLKLFFFSIATAVFCGAVYEFYRIGKAKGYQPLFALGIIGTIGYCMAVFLSSQSLYVRYLPEVMLGLIMIAGFFHYIVKGDEPFINLAITFFGLIYLTIPLATMIGINYYFPLNSVQDGRWWLLFLIVITKMTDTGAYFIGKQWGKHKFAPYISPNKTWEGAIGGLVSGIISGFIIYELANLWNPHALNISWIECLSLGILLSIVGQFGDLAESLLKRDGGIKDSNQLPGLGGMLDIVDSLVFTSPLLYLYLLSYYKIVE